MQFTAANALDEMTKFMIILTNSESISTNDATLVTMARANRRIGLGQTPRMARNRAWLVLSSNHATD